MQSGLYVALSSQIALERRLTTISDNMANVNTVGFRGSEVKFDEMVAKNHNDMNAKVAFVSQGNDYLSTRQGAFEQTGNSFDFAIKGDAWFSLDTPDGQILTRDGRFTMRPDGALISSSGYPVLTRAAAPSSSMRMAARSPSVSTAPSGRTKTSSPRSASSRRISRKASCVIPIAA